MPLSLFRTAEKLTPEIKQVLTEKPRTTCDKHDLTLYGTARGSSQSGRKQLHILKPLADNDRPSAWLTGQPR